MIAYQEIRDVHLEISSMCNASCPWCPRTFWGYPHNDGYPETNLTLQQAQKIFSPDFLKQLTHIYINGNFGDAVMNPETPDIVEYFYLHNPNIDVAISTNGGARNQEFWQRLAKTKVTVYFCLDGLEDTHHLYRQNTQWSTVIKNASIFIAQGGTAVWKLIQFEHNRHQIDECKKLSESMGFSQFLLVDDGRDTGPVFDRQGNLSHVLGKYSGPADFKTMFYRKTHDEILLEDVTQGRAPSKSVSCLAQKKRSIYVTATGDVFPCCWMGHYPDTYGHGQYYQPINNQLREVVKNNNALKNSLETCIEWFDSVEKRWKLPEYQQGRLLICDDKCGQCQ